MTRPASLLDGLPPKPTLGDTAEARLDWLILFLEALEERAPERFDMHDFFCGAETNGCEHRAFNGLDVPEMVEHDCNTCACVGGWIYSLWGAESADAAGLLVGLEYDDMRSVFYPGYIGAFNATARQAAAMLRLFRETGRVDWAAVMEGAAG